MNLHPRLLPSACLILAAAATWLSTAAAPGAELITFEFEPTSFPPNGFVSVESSHVSFSDTVGSSLRVILASEANSTRGLFVFNDDDGSALEMNFDCLVTNFSLDFGNDDPNFTVPGDLALLTTYVGDSQVGQSAVLLNRDDAMNQTIFSSGPAFTRAVFAFTNAAGSPFTGGGAAQIGLTEVVDNIRFELVPEPGLLTCLVGGLISAGAFLRGRRNTHR